MTIRGAQAGLFTTLMTLAAFSANANEAFFYDQVTQRLTVNGCASCHAQHHRTPRVFEYEQLLPYLAMGTGPKDNVLIAKMANLRPHYEEQAAHVGGQRCATVEAEPCKTFQRWWEVEFGDKSETTQETVGGAK